MQSNRKKQTKFIINIISWTQNLSFFVVFCFCSTLTLNRKKQTMSHPYLHWIPQQDCPSYNFTKPFKYSSHEFIIANSAKFKQISFIIHKFNSKENKWKRIKILPSDEEDPAEFIIYLNNPCNPYNLHSQYADTQIMDHFGITNVAYDTKKKTFYALGIDWNMWKVDLSIPQPKQCIIAPSNSNITNYQQLHGSNSNRSFICQPYLFIDQNEAYVLTPTNRGPNRYRFCCNNGKLQGL